MIELFIYSKNAHLGVTKMLNRVKSYVVLAAVLGFLAGCASTQEVDDQVEMDEPTARAGAGVGAGVDRSDVRVGADDRRDSMANVDTVFYFEFDSAVLTQNARAALLLHAEDLKNSGRSIRLEGHTDERGSREYNMALGERRANSVRDFLVLQGVRSSQIETVSYGEERPAVMGSNDYAWSQNRRVELK